MNIKKGKCVIALALSAIVILSFSSCGKKEDDKNATQGGKVSIRLWSKPTIDTKGGPKIIYEERMKKFKEKYPNVEIVEEIMKAGTTYTQEYDKALMAGLAPTGVDMFSYSDVPTRIKNGTIADITDLYEKWEYKDKMVDTFDSAIRKDGKQYAIIRSAYVMGTTYNKKAIIDGGGDINSLPVTWNDFATLGKKITNKNVPRFGYELLGTDICAWPFTAWVWSAGGEMVTQKSDGKYRLSFADQPGVDAAKFWNEMVWKYEMTQKDILQDWSRIQEDVQAGRAAFSWVDISGLSQQVLDKFGLKVDQFGVMPMPVKDATIKNPTFSGGEVVTFNPNATKEEVEAAWNFFTMMYYDEEYLTSEWKLANEYSMANLQMPARKDLYQKKLAAFDSVPESIKSDLLKAAITAKSEPFCDNWWSVKEELVKPLQEIILTKDISEEQVRNLLTKCADLLYNKYPETFAK